ncbi:MAG: type II toxin-antitoxin system HicA family toxin [Candidatus Iainarchaeum archaeon]|uniref:Type II toxin-antitoxin system HicA family toxin n=1 Tax=Candidatus Iainarchaeum sp. TaxID=3101447 RepID=A0A7T9DKC3_9ARCH|nr:MAG: type II toxin-antitoxin system HicA family toxin [Candidatus Diapherotrites archaeon]
MPRLKPISGMQLAKTFAKLGYAIDHQTGSHLILRQKTEPFRRLTIPNHSVISIGTLRAIIRQSGLTREEFEKLLH